MSFCSTKARSATDGARLSQANALRAGLEFYRGVVFVQHFGLRLDVSRRRGGDGDDSCDARGVKLEETPAKGARH